MVTKDTIFSAASKRATAWSKHPLPGYWNVLQIVALAGFGLFVGVQLISGGGGTPTAAVPALENLPAIAVASPAPAAPTTSAPAPADTAAPSTGGASVQVTDATGSPVTVPAAASGLAGNGLRALFDTAAAATVPVSGGGTYPAPARDFPDASIGSLTLVSGSASGDRLVFAAPTDADGAGEAFSPVHATVTVVRDGDTWLVELS